MITWSTAVLCNDSDLVAFETDVLAWVQSVGSASKWIAKGKEIIEQRLRHKLRDLEIATEADDVLDLIESVTPLKDLACYITLHLICNDSTTGGDLWESKGEMYWSKFQEELPRALGLINLDVDESGTISDSEKYTVPGVKFVRGS